VKLLPATAWPSAISRFGVSSSAAISTSKRRAAAAVICV
jgi:hypothetical protein